MGVPLWSTVPAENENVDPNIPARQNAPARDYIDAIQGVMAGVAAFAADQGGFATTGVGNNYVVASASKPAILADGASVVVLPNRANTGPATLELDGFGPKAWETDEGASLSAGMIVAGRRYVLTYSQTTNAWTSIFPSTGDFVINDGAVSNPKLAAAPPLTLKGNAGGTNATPSDLSGSTVRTLLGAGQANGLATLDPTGFIPAGQLPPQGDGGTAGQVVGGHKVLVSVSGALQQASADNAAHFGPVVGISLNAALAGAAVRYVTSGPIEDPSFNFTEGPVYLGLNGNLTQTYPTIAGGFAFAQQVATATAATRIVIAIQPPVLLA